MSFFLFVEVTDIINPGRFFVSAVTDLARTNPLKIMV
jgi:hypothetical protein